MIEQLILVRHGETEENLAGIAQGWLHGTLSDLGKQQVLRLAERVARMQPNALFSSPLGRALATAQAIADATGLEIRTLDALREVSLGSWEGRGYHDIRRDDSENYIRWRDDSESACPGWPLASTGAAVRGSAVAMSGSFSQDSGVSRQ